MDTEFGRKEVKQFAKQFAMIVETAKGETLYPISTDRDAEKRELERLAPESLEVLSRQIEAAAKLSAAFAQSRVSSRARMLWHIRGAESKIGGERANSRV